MARTKQTRRFPDSANPQPSQTHRCGPRHRIPTQRRIDFHNNTISLHGYPSRGGLIVLEPAGIVDFDYLNLDRLRLSLPRAENQDDEDEFCKRLLRLGARWFDSWERWEFVRRLGDGDGDGDGRAEMEVEQGVRPAPGPRERRWVRVGIPASARGGSERGDDDAGADAGFSRGESGFWVLEYDGMEMYADPECDDCEFLPDDACRVDLAATMSERCEVLREMGAKWYHDISEYEQGGGLACLNAWEWRKGADHEGWTPDEGRAQEVLPERPGVPRGLVGRWMAWVTGA